MSVPPPVGFSDFSIVHTLLEVYADFDRLATTLTKHHRYTIGTKIFNELLGILELTLLAITKNGSSRWLILNKIDVRLKLIQLLLRLLFQMQAIYQKKYIHLSGRLIELSKMNGAWLRDTKHANENDQET